MENICQLNTRRKEERREGKEGILKRRKKEGKRHVAMLISEKSRTQSKKH